MKRLLLLLGLALCGNSLAETPELTLRAEGLEGYQRDHDLQPGDEYTINQAVIPYDWELDYPIESGTAAVHFFIEDYYELRDDIDGDRAWDCEFVDGMDEDAYMEWQEWEVRDTVWLRLGREYRPQEAEESRIKVTCHWGDLSTYVFVNVIFKEVDLPTGETTVPDVVDLKVGKTSTLASANLPRP